MKTFFVLFVLLFSASTQATVSFDKECSDKFVGKVSSVLSLEIPSSPFLQKERVTFSVLSTERGNIHGEYFFDALKYGPVTFEKNAIYEVEMNQGFLCSASRVE